VREQVIPNRAYDLASCYLCGKELQAASKKSVSSKASIVAVFDDKMSQGFANESQASKAPGMINNILAPKKGQSGDFV
ncbi:29739_t:CDS:2, partial [Racocetra persica]